MLSRVSFIVVFLLIAVSANERKGVYNPKNAKYYILHEDPLRYDDAVKLCEENNSEMVKIETFAELDFIRLYVEPKTSFWFIDVGFNKGDNKPAVMDTGLWLANNEIAGQQFHVVCQRMNNAPAGQVDELLQKAKGMTDTIDHLGQEIVKLQQEVAELKTQVAEFTKSTRKSTPS